MNLNAVVARKFPPLRQTYTAKDSILYALGVGLGADPVNRSIIAFPGRWLAEPVLGINYTKVLHGEEGMVFERPLTAEATVRGEYAVVGIDDKGEGKGAVVLFEKRILDDADGKVICRVRSTYFLRGDGGCGTWGKAVEPAAPLPERTPDKVVDLPTSKRQALIYRLSGDYNPLHIDPDAAIAAGFRVPILHGLSTYGVACFGLVQQLCGGNPARLTEMFTRFSRPVFPGETIRLEMFDEGSLWRFRARVTGRDEIVLDRGVARVG
jgi:acyl dehydratase